MCQGLLDKTHQIMKVKTLLAVNVEEKRNSRRRVNTKILLTVNDKDEENNRRRVNTRIPQIHLVWRQKSLNFNTSAVSNG